MIVVWICGNSSDSCTHVCKEQNFRYFYLIGDGDMFIILFEADDPVVDNREDLHKKIIKQAAFCYLNPFCRTVIH